MANYDAIIERLQAFYGDLNVDKLHELADLYAEDVSFTDPVLTLDGRDHLHHYLHHGLGNATSCQFNFLSRVDGEGEVFLTWQMRLRHPSLDKGIEIMLPGASHLHLTSDGKRIQSHTDYYDLGAMVYEHVPVLRYLISQVRKRLEAQ